MNSELLLAIEELNDLIKKDKDVVRLSELEQIINTDETIGFLSFKMNKAFDEKEYLIKIGASKADIKVKANECIAAKKDLYANPIVKEYNSLFKKVEEMYKYINDELINPIIKVKHSCEL